MSVKAQKEYGGDGKKDTPVPMPNTEVKLLNAESSWWETACEGRQSPCSFLIFRLSSVGRHLTVNQVVVSSSLTAGVSK